MLQWSSSGITRLETQISCSEYSLWYDKSLITLIPMHCGKTMHSSWNIFTRPSDVVKIHPQNSCHNVFVWELMQLLIRLIQCTMCHIGLSLSLSLHFLQLLPGQRHYYFLQSPSSSSSSPPHSTSPEHIIPSERGAMISNVHFTHPVQIFTIITVRLRSMGCLELVLHCMYYMQILCFIGTDLGLRLCPDCM